MDSILVICLGNICRSPMAEGLLKQRYPNKKIASAGLQEVTAGWSADPFAIRVMRDNGIDIRSHRARYLTATLLKDVDLVLTMEKAQADIVRLSFPNFKGKIMPIGELLDMDISDPYAQPIQAFKDVYKRLNQSIDSLQPIINPLN